MTRERISQLDDADLIRLAQKLNLDTIEDFSVDPDPSAGIPAASRKLLEEQVFELIEENRDERREQDSDAVRYHQRQFQTIEEFFGYPVEDEAAFFTFPNQYNVTRVMLMLRDPEWAYCYWDISNRERTRLTGHPDFRFFSIVLEQLASGIAGNIPEGASDTAEETESGPTAMPSVSSSSLIEMVIPVQQQDNNWYINIPVKESSYRALLCAVFSDHREEIARSGEIYVPRGNFSASTGDTREPNMRRLLSLSGVDHLGLSAFDGSPRKLSRTNDDVSMEDAADTP